MVVLGRIGAPFGVRGWVKVLPFTAQPQNLLDFPRWWIAPAGDGWRELAIAESRVHGKALVVRPDGCADRAQAQALRGMQVAVPRSELQPARDGEYYWADLIGLSVANRDGVQFGSVEEMIATGANDVLVVRGGRERLIPFIAGVVLQVDLAGGRLVVDWGADY